MRLGDGRCVERTGLTRVERANWGEARAKNSFESADLGRAEASK